MKISVILALAAIMAVAGCIGQTTEGPPLDGLPTVGEEIPSQAAGLLEFELRDVNSGETFRLSDFSGKVVILETMAVWCPICLDQQREIKKAEAQLANDDVVSVSIDVDPNEDETRLIEHTQRNDLQWRFAIASPEMSRLLADNFGLNVLNVPSTPVFIIDRDQNFHLLRFGVKGSSEIISEVEKYL